MKPRILIVEDDLIVATNIKEKLKYKGYSVVGCCREGESVYAESTRLKPDLILMDIKLSGNMEGIDTAKRIY